MIETYIKDLSTLHVLSLIVPLLLEVYWKFLLLLCPLTETEPRPRFRSEASLSLIFSSDASSLWSALTDPRPYRIGAGQCPVRVCAHGAVSARRWPQHRSPARHMNRQLVWADKNKSLTHVRLKNRINPIF